MLRRTTCLGDVAPFEPRFGRTGGEDTDFFFRLARQGRRILWCSSATVMETIPPDRASLAYMLGRTRQGGRLFVAMAQRNSRHSRGTAMRLAIRATAQLLLWLPLQLIAGEVGLHARFRVASALGKLTWWRLQTAYGSPRALAPAS